MSGWIITGGANLNENQQMQDAHNLLLWTSFIIISALTMLKRAWAASL